MNLQFNKNKWSYPYLFSRARDLGPALCDIFWHILKYNWGGANIGLTGTGPMYPLPPSNLNWEPEFFNALLNICSVKILYRIYQRRPHPHWDRFLLNRCLDPPPNCVLRTYFCCWMFSTIIFSQKLKYCYLKMKLFPFTQENFIKMILNSTIVSFHSSLALRMIRSSVYILNFFIFTEFLNFMRYEFFCIIRLKNFGLTFIHNYF